MQRRKMHVGRHAERRVPGGRDQTRPPERGLDEDSASAKEVCAPTERREQRPSPSHVPIRSNTRYQFNNTTAPDGTRIALAASHPLVPRRVRADGTGAKRGLELKRELQHAVSPSRAKSAREAELCCCKSSVESPGWTEAARG
mmetsp:Transcript_11654/g.34262  ORF Transcript_11654/g.34262 Transcript_11654/m.34262 type:complete len:143 (+) Transcript_11654:193-621(+)